MSVRRISLVVAISMFFMASLPAFCATLCTFGACPEMDKAMAPKSCCPMEQKKAEKPVPSCKSEMNKESPAATKSDAPRLSLPPLILWVPLFLAAMIEELRLTVPHEFPAPPDHSPPRSAVGVWTSRAPPVSW